MLNGTLWVEEIGSEELARVPPEGDASKRVGDAATVEEDHQLLIGDALVNDAPALMLVVETFPWATTTEVTQPAENALADRRPGLSFRTRRSELA